MNRSRTVRAVLPAVVMAVVLISSAHAQPPEGAAADGIVVPRVVAQIPPDRFERGDAPSSVDPWLFGSAVACFVLWMYAAGWVFADSRGIEFHATGWNTLVTLGGLAGFAAVLMIPAPVAGFGLLAILAGTPCILYVLARNAHVPASAQIFTSGHFMRLVRRALGRVGISLGRSGSGGTFSSSSIRLIGKSSRGGADDEHRSRQAERSAGFVSAKELVQDAVLRRATDIHLEPKEHEIAVRLRIDGVMQPSASFDRKRGALVINIFKVLAAMDIADKRRAQDGSFRAEFEEREIDFRAATQATRFGEKLSLRVLDRSQSVGRLSELGMRRQPREELEAFLQRSHGMLLCSGPTGAGKSTTLYAALAGLDAGSSNIVTVEDPVEYALPDVNQIEIHAKAGQSFSTSLRSILRQDPDVLMIGEIRDRETAEIACQAANTGHLVLSTVHANDPFTAIGRILELGVEPYMAATAFSAILGQRLVRRLCPACKEEYLPDPDVLKQHGLPPERIERFFRPPANPATECRQCAGLGFRGRIGIFEWFVVTDALREMLREGAPLSRLKAEARRNGMLTMKEEGLRLVVGGVTSLDEMLRVVN